MTFYLRGKSAINSLDLLREWVLFYDADLCKVAGQGVNR